MAAELISPDALKIGLVAILGLGYAAYKSGLIDKIKAARGSEMAHFRPRPVYAARRVRFERAVLDICGIDHLQLIRTTARLRRIGFWIVGDFTLPTTGPPLGTGQKLFARAFVHGEEPIYALAVERKGFKAPPPYVDYFTLFTDLTFLTATNSDEDDDPRRPGALRFHRLAGLLPEELYQHHRANLEALRNNWMRAVPASREACFSHFRQWLVVDSELRRARDEEVRKDQITRTIESLPPLDIGPILKRYDSQRTPFEFAHKAGSEREIRAAAGSPTVIKDPERAPIRRRLPPSGPTGPGPAPMPDAGAVPADPTYGDELISSPGGFAEMASAPPAFYPDSGETHPLDLLDRLDAATPVPGNAGYEPVQDYGGGMVYDQPTYEQTEIQDQYADAREPAPAEPYPDGVPAYELDPAQYDLQIEPEPAFMPPTADGAPDFALGQDLGSAEFFAAETGPEPPLPAFMLDSSQDQIEEPPLVFDVVDTGQDQGYDMNADPAPPLPFIAPPPDYPPAGIPTDPPGETGEALPPTPSPQEPVAGEVRISLRQIKSWRPPDYSSTQVPELAPVLAPASAASEGPAHTPTRCPRCQARTLSRYSQRCHKCRSPLVEALTP